jgi:hypothetical protein
MLKGFDGRKFPVGPGIFLFGMFMMEESIKLLSGRSFRTLIRRYTGSRLEELITGLVSTSILQSSSAVSLMVPAFVGAGPMALVNAITVIMGAKIGTREPTHLLRAMYAGRSTQADLDRVERLCAMLPYSGRCSLVDRAVTVVESSLDKLRRECEIQLVS